MNKDIFFIEGKRGMGKSISSEIMDIKCPDCDEICHGVIEFALHTQNKHPEKISIWESPNFENSFYKVKKDGN